MKSINSIVEFHRLASLPEPSHPLVSVVRVEDMRFDESTVWAQFNLNFYTISLKRGVHAKVKYGQQYYDYDTGVMTFTAPKQVESMDMTEVTAPSSEASMKGYALLLHPDFLGRHPLATTIRNYGFFSYNVREALHLSEKEEKYIAEIFQKIDQESHHIDHHTQGIILSQIDLLLNYSNRFYQRQFITRKAASDDILVKMDAQLNEYFKKEEPFKNGLPTVEFLAHSLNLSQHYLSDMLRSITGHGAQHYIHEKLIERAKEMLATTNMSVAEIAYQLGFERPQSFNKLFRKKTDSTPLAFRQSFN